MACIIVIVNSRFFLFPLSMRDLATKSAAAVARRTVMTEATSTLLKAKYGGGR
jgi:hypothetical protein